jgi:hypothetical protein
MQGALSFSILPCGFVSKEKVSSLQKMLYMGDLPLASESPDTPITTADILGI